MPSIQYEPPKDFTDGIQVEGEVKEVSDALYDWWSRAIPLLPLGRWMFHHMARVALTAIDHSDPIEQIITAYRLSIGDIWEEGLIWHVEVTWPDGNGSHDTGNRVEGAGSSIRLAMRDAVDKAVDRIRE